MKNQKKNHIDHLMVLWTASLPLHTINLCMFNRHSCKLLVSVINSKVQSENLVRNVKKFMLVVSETRLIFVEGGEVNFF